MDHLWRDLRFAVRSLARRPLTAVVVLVTLALAIGATTAIFSIAEGVLLDPLPYPRPERIVIVLGNNLELGFPRFSISALDFRDFRDQNHVFEATAAAATTSLHLTGGGNAERLFGVRMTAELFDVLGRAPLLGRPILPSDDRTNVQKVVVLSHRLWQRRFGGDEEVLGRVIQLSGEPYEVIGVMPPDSFPYPRDFFIPVAIDFDRAERGFHDLVVFGRLKEGVTLERANGDLAAIATRLEQAYPDTNTGWGVTVNGWHDLIVEPVRPALLMLLSAVGLVLAFATLNVIHVMLARLAAREREIAIRLALGASRLQVVRTFVVESLLVTVLAGAIGALLAVLGTRTLLALYGDSLPRGANVGVDTMVLLFALALSLAIGLVVGLVPAWKASRPDLRIALSEGGTGRTAGRRSRRLRNGLVFVEVALSLVLLVGAGLLLRSFGRLAAVDPGFVTERGVTANLELPPWSYGDPEQRRVFFRQLFERLGSMPGANRFAVSSFPPISPRGFVWTFQIEGRPPARPGEEAIARTLEVSPGYFEAMGIPLNAGREFVAADDQSAELVAILNETGARRYFGAGNPIGGRIDIQDHDDPEPIWRTVVGVVADVRATGLDQPPEAFIYTPLLQRPDAQAAITLYTAGDPAAMSGPLRQTVAGLDPDVPLFEVQRLEQLIASTVSRPRFNAVLLGAFAAIALVLAAVGVYGVLAYGVSQRRREIGVRRALGADRPTVLRLILGDGLRPVALGLIAGAVAAVAANRLLASLLFGVGAGDPLSWVAAVGLLGLAGLAACWLAARQAAAIDPCTVLREE